jgi:uncharacterized membrane protein
MAWSVPNIQSIGGGANKWTIFESSPTIVLAVVILALVGVFIAGAIMLAWGLLAFLGVLLIVTAMLLVLLNKGHMQPYMFVIAVAVGIVFIALSLAGIDKGMIVDLRAVPGMQIWHDIVHAII